MMRRVGLLSVVMTVLVLFAAQPAYAYIDPGSSSMLLQIIVGGVAAVLVLTRRVWEGTLHRITRLLRRSDPLPPATDPTPPSGPESGG